MKPKFITCKRVPRLKWIKTAEIEISPHIAKIHGRDVRGKKVWLVFSPYQGFRITTIDCYLMPQETDLHRLYEVQNSDWLDELKTNLTDSTATFMNSARHFFLVSNDAAVEVVAWKCDVKRSPR